MGHQWPLFDLRLHTPRLELRLPTDDDLLALAKAARGGVHDRPESPFLVRWDEPPSPAMERQFLLHGWKVRGEWSPARWNLGFAAVLEGRPIGMQEVFAVDFARTRTVATGSWLALAHHGRGYGTEMRAAILWLAFEELGALAAESGYLEGNEPSARVSGKLGYGANGERLIDARTQPPRVERMMRVTPATWNRALVPVRVEGMDACRGLFGERELPPEAWTTF